MTSSLYLDMLDDLLRPGIAALSEQFTATQVRFVAGRQQPDGGFGGRRGSSDLYYTDFALRTLAWLAPRPGELQSAPSAVRSPAFRRNVRASSVGFHAAFPPEGGTTNESTVLLTPRHTAFERAADFPNCYASLPHSIVECFNRLNIRRLLKRRLPSTCDAAIGECRPSPLINWLHAQMLPGGGFARLSDDRVSAYHTFLGSLCFQLLGIAMPAVDDAIRTVANLQRPDGGYAELADQPASQTSATAAAMAFLAMHNALPPEKSTGAVPFLAKMQSADGGLKPHAAAPCGDLLSTFTGLLTLCSLGGFSEIDVPRVARFLQRTAHPAGGFLACDTDDSPDIEYTYYGIGTFALLRLAEGQAETQH
jgi:geranylgeranyl transferase type-2 subunit beta